MIHSVSPTDLVEWSGLTIGGTIVTILFLFITENTDLAVKRKQMQSAIAKKNEERVSEVKNNEEDNGDLIPFNELRKLIPKSLFVRHLPTSMYYFIVDLIICVICQLLYHYTIHELDSRMEGLISVPIILAFDIAFIWLCGTCETGLWVVAHECGHHAFSDYPLLDNSIGFTLHSYLLAPYFPWQYSHSVHHSRNKHIDMDETHNPKKIRPGKKVIKLPARFHKRKVLAPIFGWYTYLGFGQTGAKRNRAGKEIKVHSHFYKSDLFPREYPSWKIWISNLGMLVTCLGIYSFAQTFGWWEAFRKFIGPRLVTNYWLVFITTANHTHHDLKYMDDSKWSWYEGAIRTMDYQYGSNRSLLLRIAGEFFDFITLRIASTHVCHHLFSKMPHYNCKKATPIIKKALGRHYKQPDSTATACFFLHMYSWAYKNDGDGEYTYAN